MGRKKHLTASSREKKYQTKDFSVDELFAKEVCNYKPPDYDQLVYWVIAIKTYKNL